MRNPATPRKRKLTMKEAAELAALPIGSMTWKRQREAAYLALSDPTVLRDGAAVADAWAKLAALAGEIDAAVARWEALETLATGAEQSTAG